MRAATRGHAPPLQQTRAQFILSQSLMHSAAAAIMTHHSNTCCWIHSWNIISNKCITHCSLKSSLVINTALRRLRNKWCFNILGLCYREVISTGEFDMSLIQPPDPPTWRRFGFLGNQNKNKESIQSEYRTLTCACIHENKVYVHYRLLWSRLLISMCLFQCMSLKLNLFSFIWLEGEVSANVSPSTPAPRRLTVFTSCTLKGINPALITV